MLGLCPETPVCVWAELQDELAEGPLCSALGTEWAYWKERGAAILEVFQF